jgi:hypothetical protein
MKPKSRVTGDAQSRPKTPCVNTSTEKTKQIPGYGEEMPKGAAKGKLSPELEAEVARLAKEGLEMFKNKAAVRELSPTAWRHRPLGEATEDSDNDTSGPIAEQSKGNP